MQADLRVLAKELVEVVKNLALVATLTSIGAALYFAKGHVLDEAGTDRMLWTLIGLACLVGLIGGYLFAAAIHSFLKPRFPRMALIAAASAAGMIFSIAGLVIGTTLTATTYAHFHSQGIHDG